MIDWGVGQYEVTALEIGPVAEHVVAQADLRNGERVLDLATGTGNAALLAARAGATATGVDTAARLLEVARGRAERDGLEATFLQADIQELPFDDGSFDVALSVFGVIFAPDPRRALAEAIRVLRPGGRAIFSVWVPAGTIDAMVGTFGAAVAEVTGSAPARFAWYEPDAVEPLVNGADVRWHDSQLRISADSPEAYLARVEEAHPMSIASRPVLEGAGKAPAVRQRALEILRDGNEQRDGFVVHSPYRLIELRKHEQG